MSDYPETRASLILRLKNDADQAAWGEFVEIYWPIVYRLARRKGLQDADAEDLAQQVLASVAAAVHRWDPDRAPARFRTWLHRIARNRIINALTRRKPDRAAGGDSAEQTLADQAAGGPDSELLRDEHRREVLHWAARQIRGEFAPDTWLAFWRTTVEGRSAAVVAAELGKSVGAVYTARSRVMKRLRDKVSEWDSND
ncbi:MAG TPA: sigma-70 family RNA polymerase sigma factor [Gemmataceae bacterium]